MKALAGILRDRRLRVSVRVFRERDTLPERGVLRVLPASFIEPAVSLLWGDDIGRYDARDHELGLSPAVWTSGWDRWLYQAGTPRALRGIPDYGKPWVLVGPSVPGSVGSVQARVGIPGAQLHFLSVTARAPEGSVVWLPTARAARFLLARVEAVLARRGALALDAERSGLPVVVEAPSEPNTEQIWVSAACNVVPEAVQHDPRFWNSVADRLAGAGPASVWGTRSWVLQSREAVRSQSGLIRWARKLQKWRRDPVSFWRDSRFVRWLG
ncbi:MAG TPA: hypothetical protein VHP33_19790 [Polyangiaceae bacterium]|nr:hypothetical protein [Polyangiaceae bacterium]